MKKVKHIKILGFGDPGLLGDADVICKFIDTLIDSIGMRPLGTTTIHNVALDIMKLNKEPFEDEGGITAQCGAFIAYNTLSTSHIALHSWPLRKEFHLDIYSCRYFDADSIEEFINTYFDCSALKITDLSKATEWD